MTSIFICHSSNDKQFVENLVIDLTRNKIRVWLDKWEIKVGDSIVDKINSGISDYRYMGIVLSPNSIKSSWVRKELNAGFIKEIEEKRVVILPILLQSCKIPPLIKDKKYADFTNDYNEGLKELLDTLGKSHLKKIKSEKDIIDDNNLFKDNFYNDNFYDENIIE